MFEGRDGSELALEAEKRGGRRRENPFFCHLYAANSIVNELDHAHAPPPQFAEEPIPGPRTGSLSGEARPELRHRSQLLQRGRWSRGLALLPTKRNRVHDGQVARSEKRTAEVMLFLSARSLGQAPSF